MKFRLSGQFGELSPVRNWQPHSGIDVAMPEGTTLRSIAGGVVDKVFDGSGAIGKGLSVKMPDGTRTIYGHLSEVKAKIGERVSSGEIIGLSGNTGNSTGPHLHFGMKDAGGHVVDPTPATDNLIKMLNNDTGETHFGLIGELFKNGTEGVREHVKEVTTEALFGIFDALKDLLLGATLMGTGVCILLKVCGWRDGGRWAGVLIGVNILLKFLFGGV
ncbi:M23 family metallopeptidase [Neobacillus sp. MM2021_6]|uniref:M23 family metallopeptidase n=1 Tax=Bacillaceae TaxID=186817 RepID=UPI00140AB74E|nr:MULTISPECIES: M23 family metallopeptidase [Bacillaceae]MBO0962403.1 M23 family metallopeptidase [Neobacillus sp. MM2021_6]NHC21028.1 M23 family metallopeptidase [Bacillus sp. MM2020_4]